MAIKTIEKGIFLEDKIAQDKIQFLARPKIYDRKFPMAKPTNIHTMYRPRTLKHTWLAHAKGLLKQQLAREGGGVLQKCSLFLSV